MRYKGYLIFFRIVTAVTLVWMSFSTLGEWHTMGMIHVLFAMALSHGLFRQERFLNLWKGYGPWVKGLVDFALYNGLLYTIHGFDNHIYIVLYCFIIADIAIHLGKKTGILVLFLCMGLSFLRMDTHSDGYVDILFQLYLYGSSLMIGSFIHEEGLINGELSNKVKEFRALYKISKIIDEFPGTDEILTNIAKIVAETMEVATSMIMFYDEEKDQLTAQYGHGLWQESLKQRILGPGDGLERQLVDYPHQKIMISNRMFDLSKDEFISGGQQVHSIVAVPLFLNKKIIGTLGIYDDKSSRLTEMDKELLFLLSTRIGVVLQNDRLYKQVKHHATLDGLTGLYNHKQFYEKLAFELGHAKDQVSKMYLLMVDIDKFKGINDRFGHVVGDQVLVGIANAIKSSIRDTDVAARYGGEEFAVILPGATHETAILVAHRIRNSVKEVVDTIDLFKDQQVNITVSIGMSCYPNCTKDMVGLVNMADVRMYKGKALGGDKVIA